MRGYDGGKRLTGRKRHILVDTDGQLLGVKVTPANVNDRDGAEALFRSLVGHFPRLKRIWADQGYKGRDFAARVQETLGAEVDVMRHPTHLHLPKDAPLPPAPAGFQVQPRRWVVERTFAWLGRNRRLAKDFEGLPEAEEAFFYLASAALLVRRLAH